MKYTRGFTLMEMSIVIVVIGLLVGGLVAAREAYNQSRIATTYAERGKYVQAMTQFRDKYGSLPGDMANATSFWTDGAGSCGWTDTTAPTTCNGDGNGQIADQTNFVTRAYESHRAWQHMANAGFIEGGYTGGFESAEVANTTAGAVVVTPGTRVPKAKYKDNAGWHLYFIGPQSGSAVFFDGDYGHVLYLGQGAYAVSAANKGVLASEDMLTLDTKFDDAVPSTGMIRSGAAAGVFGGACVTSATAYAAAQTTCIPLFLTGL